VGELIVLAERLADRSRPVAGTEAAFFFDLVCPFSYLAAERIERELGNVDWIPAAGMTLHGKGHPAHSVAARTAAERMAAELRLPLVWPEQIRAAAPSALRAAMYASERGAGAQFALAASRLAFCGGFDLEDPEILAEAAAAAGVPLDECLDAAGEVSRDGAAHATARGLRSRGLRELPAVRVHRSWFSGQQAVAEAGAMIRAGQTIGRPLAPAS
jgi:2-hydroxychromene-2-carboxylate isomerase